MRKFGFTLVSLVALMFSVQAWAGDQHKADGVVKAVKADQKRLSIAHGPIKSMGMSGMTMDFGVYDPGMLDEVQVGSNISFVFETDKDGNFVIMELEEK